VTPSLIVLLAANAVPIFGVLFLGWTVLPLVLIYWLENVVIGGFNVLKMAREGLMLPLRTAINKAKKEKKSTFRKNATIGANETSPLHRPARRRRDQIPVDRD